MNRPRFLILALATIFTLALIAPIHAGASGTISFSPGPAQTGVSTTITSISFNPSGAPIRVASDSGGSITVSIDPSTNPGGATLSGHTTSAVVSGFATFSDLSIDLHGIYRLIAASNSTTSDSGATATSQAFAIWDGFDTCQGLSDRCDKKIGSLTANDQTTEAAANSAGGTGVVALSQGEDNLTCSDPSWQRTHGPATVTIFTSGVTGEIVVTLVFSQSYDHLVTQNGSSFYQVCFTYDKIDPSTGLPKTFVDASGNVVTTGVLPTCSPSVVPPCVDSRSKKKIEKPFNGGNPVIVVRVPDDLKMH